MAEERPYGLAASFDFPLVTVGSIDFTTAAVFDISAGDIQLSKDGSTWALINSTTAAVQLGLNRGVYTLDLDSTEMEFARATLTIIDQTSTKIWEDQAILITTFGSSNGSTAALKIFNLNSTSPNVETAAITAGAVTSTAFATGAITSTAIAAGAIGSTQLGTDAITAGKIANAAITTNELDAGVFTKIDAGTNQEVLDVITVDLFGDPITTTDAPPVSNTLANKQGYLYGTYRNGLDISTAAKTFRTSTGGIAFTKVISDTGTYIELETTTA